MINVCKDPIDGEHASALLGFTLRIFVVPPNGDAPMREKVDELKRASIEAATPSGAWKRWDEVKDAWLRNV